MKLHIFGLAAAAAAIVSSPASAAEPGTKAIAVRYADLNLSSAEGRAQLETRIDRAAREACEMDRATTGTRLRSSEARECYQEARRALDQHFAQLIDESSATS